MSTAKWYYLVGDEQIGPVTSEELKARVADGTIGSDDLVWKEGLKDWVPARRVKGLFPTVVKDPFADDEPARRAPAADSFDEFEEPEPATFMPARVRKQPQRKPASGPVGRGFDDDDRPRSRSRSIDPAGFWKRFAAALLDGFILGAVMTPVFCCVAMGAAGAQGPGGGPRPGGPGQPRPEIINAVGLMFQLAAVGVGWLYSALMESSSYQGTLGKLAIGIKVTDIDGNPIGFGQATGRHFAKILSSMFCCIGFIMAGFTEKKQALHDMVAGCLVVNK